MQLEENLGNNQGGSQKLSQATVLKGQSKTTNEENVKWGQKPEEEKNKNI